MDYFKLLEQFSKASDLPVSIFEQQNLIFKGHTDKLDYNMPMFLMECLPAELPDIWVSHTPEKLFFGGLRLKKQKQLLILGPVCAYECSITQCEQILRRLGRKQQEVGTFQKAVNHFALCGIPYLRNYLKFLNHILNGIEDVEIPGIDFKWKTLFSMPDEYYIDMETENKYEEEENLLAYIRNGKVEEVENYLNEVYFGANRQMDRDNRDLNLRRSYIFGHNILVSRMAIQAGVDAQMARNLAGYYSDLLMRADNLTDMNRIFYKMTVDYAKKIQMIHEFEPEDLLSKRVNGFVQAHLYGKLSTAVIAEALHINEAHLCEKFRKSTGQTITKLIQECKIREAKFLLEKGHLPTEVSDMLEFSSSSYFCAVFKKITGVTPMEYKKSVE